MHIIPSVDLIKFKFIIQKYISGSINSKFVLKGLCLGEIDEKLFVFSMLFSGSSVCVCVGGGLKISY